jgi:hypothetical protein
MQDVFTELPGYGNGSESLEILARHRGRPCLSFYLPLERGAATRKNGVVLKNLVTSAHQRLASAGDDTSLLEPFYALCEQGLAASPGASLALFRAPDLALRIPLAEAAAADVHVGDRFYLKPLLAALASRERFLILTLALHQVRIFEASRHDIRELEPPAGLPSRPEDVLAFEDERQLQVHSSSSPARHQAGIFHGHGVGKDDLGGKIQRYIALLHDTLSRELPVMPTVVIGPVNLVPLFRRANKRLTLAPHDIIRNPQDLSLDELRDLAWPVAAKVFTLHAEQQRAVDLEGSQRVTHDPAGIVLAAAEGRIESLFVPRDGQLWGHFDAAERTVELAPEPTLLESEDGVVDLYDFAATRAFLNGARVFVVDHHELPTTRAEPTAVLRW